MGLTSSALTLTLATLSWVIFRQEIWNLSSTAPMIPLKSSVFELPMFLLGNHRLILPDWSMPLITALLSIIGPLTAVCLFAIARKGFDQSRLLSFSVSLVALIAVYPFSLPGADPSAIFPWLASLFFLIPLFKPLSSLSLWLFASLGLLLTLISPAQLGFVFWLAMSFAFARLFHFLLIDRLSLKRSERRNLSVKFLQFTGGLLLLLSIAMAAQRNGQLQAPIGYSKLWYLSVSGGLLALLLSAFQPWQTLRWLSLATFCQGLLFFKNLEISVIVAHMIMTTLIIAEISQWLSKRLQLLQSDVLRVAYVLGSLAIAFGAMTWIGKYRSLERDFNPEWIEALNSIDRSSDKGAYVLGGGLFFLSHFRPAQFTYDPSLVLESSEDRWADYLKNANLNSIIIEVPKLQEFWSDWISAGKNPDKINRSLLNRIVDTRKRSSKEAAPESSSLRNFKVDLEPRYQDLMIVRLMPQP